MAAIPAMDGPRRSQARSKEYLPERDASREFETIEEHPARPGVTAATPPHSRRFRSALQEALGPFPRFLCMKDHAPIYSATRRRASEPFEISGPSAHRDRKGERKSGTSRRVLWAGAQALGCTEARDLIYEELEHHSYPVRGE